MKTVTTYLLSALPGLIIGVAILSIMNIANDSLNASITDLENTSAFFQSTEGIIYLWGKIIALITGSFIAGAVSFLTGYSKSYLVPLFIGVTFMLIIIIDFTTYTFPFWYILNSSIICIPSAFIGTMFIKRIQIKNN